MLLYPILTILAFFSYYLINEIIHNKYKKTTYFTRKLAHVFSGVGAYLVTLYLDRTQFLIVTGFFALAFIVFYKYKTFKSIHMKDTIGEILYPIALFILALFLYDNKILFIPGIFILALSDTVSAILGKKNTVMYNPVQSFLGHSITTLFILLLFNFPILSAIVFALILGLVEFKTFKGWDNLSVPLVYIVLIILFKF
jgi:phytol kinase